MPARAQAAAMKPVSKAALWAIMGLPPQKSRKARMASPSLGAPATSLSRMPVSSVMLAGMGIPGSTKLEKVSSTRAAGKAHPRQSP